MNMIELGFRLLSRVGRFRDRVRQFYYEVALAQHRCPQCEGRLQMAAEGRCACTACGCAFDPTEAFQRCARCSGKPRRSIRRYRCSACNADVPSRYLFDGIVFDADYFREKMVEHRRRDRERREQVKRLLAGTRSSPINTDAIDLGTVPGLEEALNCLVGGVAQVPPRDVKCGFDLKRYQRHINAHLRDVPLAFEDIPCLEEDGRLDRIWRFIAIIFLTHAGIISVTQRGSTILVTKHETHTERQGFPGEAEDTDGVEGSMGGIEAW